MRRIISFFLLLLPVCAAAQSSHVVCIKHDAYTSYFDTVWHIPVMVAYVVNAQMMECDDKWDRTDKFYPDPFLRKETNLQRDYTKSGYDRGHNMSAASSACDSTHMAECFYFSNMTPQPHAFNNGRWKELEKMERDWAEKYKKIQVYVGSLTPLKRIGPDKVCVPKYMYKVLYRPDDSTYTCYLFPNSATATLPLNSYKVTLNSLKKKAGINFKYGEAKAAFITKAAVFDGK